ncbi:c-type cytochrome [Polaromonas sp.]|uniref:c-type cytochrome n=1 Tax=Polaromonas sp. TaxID=1869339 RepID=UPI0018526B2C|nr:c-type cytochrome [Polaromonas sp.]NML86443.1 c-type cytochrome [Polaromonas sp.]
MFARKHHNSNVSEADFCTVKRIAASVLLCVAVTTTSAHLAKQGQQIAAQGTSQGVAACISCHGAKGEGMGAFPRLAGTGEAYLLAQLDAFAIGARKNPIMQPIAQGLQPAERQAVAMYFSQLQAPLLAVDLKQPLTSDTGAWLATRGRWADQVPACTQCHGPGGSGVGAPFPPLAGLPAAYIAEQLQAWKAGNRPPGPLALMAGVAKKLSDAEITAVAAYYEKIALPKRTGIPDVPRAAGAPGVMNPAAPTQTKGAP